MSLVISFVIFFFISANSLFCLSLPSLLGKEKNKKNSILAFKESIQFLDYCQNDFFHKKETKDLLLYWKDLTEGKISLLDGPLNPEFIQFIQELKKYEQHFLICLRYILNCLLSAMNNTDNHFVTFSEDCLLDNFEFTEDRIFNESITIQDFMEQCLYPFIHNYSLTSFVYKEPFVYTTVTSLLFYLRNVEYIFFCKYSFPSDAITQNLSYWKEQIRRFDIVLEQFQRNVPINDYIRKMFQSLGINISDKDIECFVQYEALLFNVNIANYPNAKKDKVFFLLHDMPLLFSFSEECFDLITKFIKKKYDIDIIHIRDMDELKFSINELNKNYVGRKLSVGIILNQEKHLWYNLFPSHVIPYIITKKKLKEINIYGFDSQGESPLSGCKVDYEHCYYISKTIIHRTFQGCHLFSLYLLMMALKDIKDNCFEIKDMISIKNEKKVRRNCPKDFHFPLRWASCVQSWKNLKKPKGRKKKWNNKVISMNIESEFQFEKTSCFLKEEFSSKNKNKFSPAIALLCNIQGNKEDNQRYVPNKYLIKNIDYSSVFEKQMSAFCIKTLIEALSLQMNEPQTPSAQKRKIFEDIDDKHYFKRKKGVNNDLLFDIECRATC